MSKLILRSNTNKAGSYDDASITLVKRLAKEYRVSEADAVALLLQETAAATASKKGAKDNVLQLSPDDSENWNWVQEQIKRDPSKAREWYTRGSLNRYRDGLVKGEGDSAKAMWYYHSNESAENNKAYVKHALRLKADSIRSGFVKDSPYLPPPEFEERAVHKELRRQDKDYWLLKQLYEEGFGKDESLRY